LTCLEGHFHLHGVRFFPWKLPALAFLLATFVVPLAGAEDGRPVEYLQVVRAKDQVTIYAGTTLLSLTENIVFETLGDKVGRPGTGNRVDLIIYPLWIKEGDSLRPAFPVLRPRLTLSHGRVRRFVLTHPDGESVGSIAQATPECAYVLSLEFGHVIPKRFTVSIDLATAGIRRETELTFMASNDGQPLRSGPAESTYTELRVFPDSQLQPWLAAQGEQVLARVNSATVHLERGVSHVIRFGPNAERAGN
jgi:hypothetical protein